MLAIYLLCGVSQELVNAEKLNMIYGSVLGLEYTNHHGRITWQCRRHLEYQWPLFTGSLALILLSDHMLSISTIAWTQCRYAFNV